MATAVPKQLYEPCPHCGGLHPGAEAALPPDFANKVSREIARIVTELYGGANIVTDTALLKLVGSILESQVTEGFGKTFAQVDFSTPDAEMLTRLTRDTWNFSAAKNYQQLRDMTLALRDESGNIRSLSEFKEIARTIDSQFNERFLKTEYNLALGSATMASRWTEFMQNAEDMPYLQYQTAGDERVRTEHQLLDNVIRKITDNFWKTHYPPNGYGCRCDVIQLSASVATETENIPDVKVPTLFRTNLAQTGLIYPAGHPYYDGVPQDVLRQAIASLPSEAAYKVITNGVRMHILHGIKEAPNNIKLAKILAEHGYKVDLLPVLENIDEVTRERIYGTKPIVPNKNPDSKVNKIITELKTPDVSTKNSIHQAIREGQQQADNVIILLPETMNEEEIKNAVKGQMNQAKYVENVWVVNKTGEPLKYSRKSLGLSAKAERPAK